MNKFNVGDKVRCVDNTDSAHLLSVNQTYTVHDYITHSTGLLTLEETQGVFFETRFELVQAINVAVGNDSPIIGGIKLDEGKPDLSLLSSLWIVGVGEVLTFGKKKYAAHNWRKGLALSRLLAAALRHIFAFLRGEDTDPETGLSHLHHASCCLMFASEMHSTRPDMDDRFKPETKE